MWLPLESNPEVMNRYMRKLGVGAEESEEIAEDNAEAYFTDVFGVDDELLAMVPETVLAVLLVFPVTDQSEADSAALRATQTEAVAALQGKNPLFYMKQHIPNACGTIGMLHALVNNYSKLGPVRAGSLLEKLRNLGEGSTSEAIEQFVNTSSELREAHSESAATGDTKAEATPVDLHFTCYIHCGGQCVELDGRQGGPILHGECEPGTRLLYKAAECIKHKMSLAPDRIEYSMTALCGK